MTETTSGPAARKGKRPRKGLTVQRINTTPGMHPYDQVTWERRDVVMTNWRDGSVNFEQRGVEFPGFWSVNAANIVTSKYFRGAVGSPEPDIQREFVWHQLETGQLDLDNRRSRGNRPGTEHLEYLGHDGFGTSADRICRQIEPEQQSEVMNWALYPVLEPECDGLILKI